MSGFFFRDEAYHKALSRASQMTLKYQGGPMSKEEANAFESSDYFHTVLDLRQWDDLGKEPSVPETEERTLYYKTLCRNLLHAQEQILMKEEEEDATQQQQMEDEERKDE